MYIYPTLFLFLSDACEAHVTQVHLSVSLESTIELFNPQSQKILSILNLKIFQNINYVPNERMFDLDLRCEFDFKIEMGE